MSTQLETNPISSNAFAKNDERWLAVQRREPAADGSFFYAVETTGVYCRPSCASRRARRENVRFYTSAEEAERAGFRPCKRCRPDGEGIPAERARLIEEACRKIDSAEEPPPLAELAAGAGLSPYHFHRLFKAEMGITPRAYASERRAQRVRADLTRAPTVTRALHEAGFGSSSRFYEGAESLLGMTPSAYRRGGAGVVIRFAHARCSLGFVLVAATERGVCSILLGDEPESLRADLERRFPRADVAPAAGELGPLVERAVALVDAPARGVELPLDIRGTAFQRRVWQALSEVPPGSTRSYSELARDIGAPKAVRAVARACAQNPLAVAIPCHRALGKQGALTGYRWGLERKRALLEREKPR